MKSKFRLGVLALTMTALMAFASTAMAKGGTGGGGVVTGGCAQATLSHTITPTDGGALVTVNVGVTSTCLDEGGGPQSMSVVLTSHNNTTGFTGTSVWGTAVGPFSWSSTSFAPTGTSATLNLAVYSLGNKKPDATATDSYTV